MLNGAIGYTIGVNGINRTDRWLSMMQTIYSVGNITNAVKPTIKYEVINFRFINFTVFTMTILANKRNAKIYI